uniref:Uncharacterized protein n=1 Tax=Junco hyemalis TaxID=40217 RepID=A0A8C5J4A5_JUNHY
MLAGMLLCRGTSQRRARSKGRHCRGHIPKEGTGEGTSQRVALQRAHPKGGHPRKMRDDCRSRAPPRGTGVSEEQTPNKAELPENPHSALCHGQPACSDTFVSAVAPVCPMCVCSDIFVEQMCPGSCSKGGGSSGQEFGQVPSTDPTPFPAPCSKY